jgi:predicted RNase H-like nuclease (RuvC/YqgF family)
MKNQTSNAAAKNNVQAINAVSTQEALKAAREKMKQLREQVKAEAEKNKGAKVDEKIATAQKYIRIFTDRKKSFESKIAKLDVTINGLQERVNKLTKAGKTAQKAA